MGSYGAVFLDKKDLSKSSTMCILCRINSLLSMSLSLSLCEHAVVLNDYADHSNSSLSAISRERLARLLRGTYLGSGPTLESQRYRGERGGGGRRAEPCG